MNNGYDINRYNYDDDELGGRGPIFKKDHILLDTPGYPILDYELQIIDPNTDEMKNIIKYYKKEYGDHVSCIDRRIIDEELESDLPQFVTRTKLPNLLESCESDIENTVYTINNKHIIIYNKYDIHDGVGVDHIIIIKKLD